MRINVTINSAVHLQTSQATIAHSYSITSVAELHWVIFRWASQSYY